MIGFMLVFLGTAGSSSLLKKKLVHSGKNEIEITVDSIPTKAGIDPLKKLIDRVPVDNVIQVK